MVPKSIRIVQEKKQRKKRSKRKKDSLAREKDEGSARQCWNNENSCQRRWWCKKQRQRWIRITNYNDSELKPTRQGRVHRSRKNVMEVQGGKARLCYRLSLIPRNWAWSTLQGRAHCIALHTAHCNAHCRPGAHAPAFINAIPKFSLQLTVLLFISLEHRLLILTSKELAHGRYSPFYIFSCLALSVTIMERGKKQ